MNTRDLTVLRALARLSRMRKAVDYEALALRAGGSLEEARASIGRLARASLVVVSDRTGRGVQLTMEGLCVAVASGRQAAAARASAAARVAERRVGAARIARSSRPARENAA